MKAKTPRSEVFFYVVNGDNVEKGILCCFICLFGKN